MTLEYTKTSHSHTPGQTQNMLTQQSAQQDVNTEQCPTTASNRCREGKYRSQPNVYHTVFKSRVEWCSVHRNMSLMCFCKAGRCVSYAFFSFCCTCGAFLFLTLRSVFVLTKLPLLSQWATCWPPSGPCLCPCSYYAAWRLRPWIVSPL